MRHGLFSSLFGLVMMMCLVVGWHVSLALPARAEAGVADAARAEILATYAAFVEAQNDRDPHRIGAYFIDGPEFLWVSDGRSVWGRNATLERMGGFQRAEVWTVLPDLPRARLVMLGEDSAMLHLSLVLEIGAAASPNRLPFLVTILWVAAPQTAEGWRIAGLLTTADKTAQ